MIQYIRQLTNYLQITHSQPHSKTSLPRIVHEMIPSGYFRDTIAHFANTIEKDPELAKAIGVSVNDIDNLAVYCLVFTFGCTLCMNFVMMITLICKSRSDRQTKELHKIVNKHYDNLNSMIKQNSFAEPLRIHNNPLAMISYDDDDDDEL
ncbi:hypothetical protein TetV_053 [Tetraselmis virus 1]|uniref:Uncharacterized protein n=1 Tax=Tetraselmis virus 1 TaxID=2060617 RepID=A0A2P0VMM0_9VIRU|nr:hypothetical protein QJ968_gp053 [Tetraselmis virus 1]AUF82145.1 hypothetical protein TetV_053 [Tetraselmis virus 1]